MAPSPGPARRALLMDALLLLMVLIWGGNYSLIKATLGVLPPRAFNALRMAVASAAFLALLAWMWQRGARGPRAAADAGLPAPTLVDRILGLSRPSRGDWLRLVVTGLVGHTLYQLLFIEGLARTTAANAALLIGCSPIVVSVASAVAGHDRLSRAHWAGLALSFSGVYLVVGRNAHVGTGGMTGDFLMMGAVLCWAGYALLSRTLLDRHSPLLVTGWSMIAGTVCFAGAVWGDLMRVSWADVPPWAIGATVFSALTALTLAYLIYYVSVMRIGLARTTVWTNVTPVVGMLIAWAALGDPVDVWKIGGAALILAGVALTRVASRSVAASRSHGSAPDLTASA